LDGAGVYTAGSNLPGVKVSKPKVLATTAIFRPLLPLVAGMDLENWSEPGRMPRPELLKRVRGKEGLLCTTTDKVDAEVLDLVPTLRVVSTMSVGTDHVNIEECRRRRITVTNTPGVLDDTTADLAWALLMCVARRIAEGDAWTRSGTWTGIEFDRFLGADVWGKTLGVVGFGRIGREVARRASGFKMRVVYYNRNRLTPELEKEFAGTYVSMDQLLAESDFVSVNTPLTPDTRHLISADSLAKMKRTAFLINTARGPVVDESALVAALEAGEIAGAGLDVYENEPKVHPGLIGRKNVVLAPHIGSATIGTRTAMAKLAIENAVAFFEGRKPPNALNAA
jgi:glyoxylate reductase